MVNLSRDKLQRVFWSIFFPFSLALSLPTLVSSEKANVSSPKAKNSNNQTFLIGKCKIFWEFRGLLSLKSWFEGRLAGLDKPSYLLNQLFQLNICSFFSWGNVTLWNLYLIFTLAAEKQTCMPVFLLAIGTKLLHLILHKNHQFSVYFTLLFLFLSANCSRMRICRVIWLQRFQQ